ncbi:MAG: FMN-binding protein [Phycisphaerae bacterium]|nr:FMN-binding protein [Phycisphaerae bacterium]
MRLDPNKNPAYVILFTALVSGLFTAGIMALHVATEPVVRANERLLTEKALVRVFALGDPSNMTAERIAETIRTRVAGLDPDRPDEPLIEIGSGDRKVRLLVAYKEPVAPGVKPDLKNKDNVLAYAFPIRGVGFWAMINGWLAVTPDGTKTVGVVFTDHQETPGLGGRITESEFRDQFRGKNVTAPPPGEKFIDISRTGEGDRHVDAITGATGTSTAVEKFINADLMRFRAAATKAGLIQEGKE